MKHNLEQCKASLDRSGIRYVSLENTEAGQCTLKSQINVRQSLYPYSAPVRGQCALITALTLWERRVIKPLAEQYFRNDVASITHYGMFSCRNIRGSSLRSEHASANAIDIAAFRLNDGQKISVLDDWHGDTSKSKFLKEVHKQSCGLFNGVLGPNYNALHRDHFHLDLGPYQICR